MQAFLFSSKVVMTTILIQIFGLIVIKQEMPKLLILLDFRKTAPVELSI